MNCIQSQMKEFKSDWEGWRQNVVQINFTCLFIEIFKFFHLYHDLCFFLYTTGLSIAEFYTLTPLPPVGETVKIRFSKFILNVLYLALLKIREFDWRFLLKIGDFWSFCRTFPSVNPVWCFTCYYKNRPIWSFVFERELTVV